MADKIKPGFEMLIDNFSLGILGGALAVLGKLVMGPIIARLVEWAGSGVDFLVAHTLLPLASIFVEPAKVLFLNNAINNGVFTLLGTIEAGGSAGKSLLFMIESNPGPGLGILVAFMLFGPRLLKAAAPGAIIIHFFGGIHEVYFPFILAKPKLILATILGGMTGVLIGVYFNGGLVDPSSPGSIFAWIAFTPPALGTSWCCSVGSPGRSRVVCGGVVPAGLRRVHDRAPRGAQGRRTQPHSRRAWL